MGGSWGHTHAATGDHHIHPQGYECTEPGSLAVPVSDVVAGLSEGVKSALREAGKAAGAMITAKGGSAGTAEGPGEPGEVTIRRHPDGGYMGAATVVNGGQEVNLRDMLTEPWQPALAERLTRTLGRKYLAHQLVSMLPADVALRLVDRVDEVVEHKVAEEVERIHQDVDGAVTTTLARLAEQADTKRRELSRERFTGHTRLS